MYYAVRGIPKQFKTIKSIVIYVNQLDKEEKKFLDGAFIWRRRSSFAPPVSRGELVYLKDDDEIIYRRL